MQSWPIPNQTWSDSAENDANPDLTVAREAQLGAPGVRLGDLGGSTHLLAVAQDVPPYPGPAQSAGIVSGPSVGTLAVQTRRLS